MKACVLESVGNLVLRDVPDPCPKENEVQLKIKACGICSSDVPRIFVTGTYHFPTVLGHEFAGEIAAVGKNVDPSYIGKRASVFPLLPCRSCPSCAIEEYARCEHYSYFGSRCDGAFAEYLAVPLWNIVLVPDSLPYTAAAMCEPAAVAKHCVDGAGLKPGETVAVIGSGTIGMLAAMWCQVYGAKRIILLSRTDEKAEFVEKLGIAEPINSEKEGAWEKYLAMTDGQGADVVLECVGSNPSIAAALTWVKKGGRVSLTGNPEGDITLPKNIYWRILRGEITVVGTWNSSYNDRRNDWKTAVEQMTAGQLPVERLITHRFPLEEYQKAFEVVRSRDELSVKVMFTMEGENK